MLPEWPLEKKKWTYSSWCPMQYGDDDNSYDASDEYI